MWRRCKASSPLLASPTTNPSAPSVSNRLCRIPASSSTTSTLLFSSTSVPPLPYGVMQLRMLFHSHDHYRPTHGLDGLQQYASRRRGQCPYRRLFGHIPVL